MACISALWTPSVSKSKWMIYLVWRRSCTSIWVLFVSVHRCPSFLLPGAFLGQKWSEGSYEGGSSSSTPLRAPHAPAACSSSFTVQEDAGQVCDSPIATGDDGDDAFALQVRSLAGSRAASPATDPSSATMPSVSCRREKSRMTVRLYELKYSEIWSFLVALRNIFSRSRSFFGNLKCNIFDLRCLYFPRCAHFMSIVVK